MCLHVALVFSMGAFARRVEVVPRMTPEHEQIGFEGGRLQFYGEVSGVEQSELLSAPLGFSKSPSAPGTARAKTTLIEFC